MQTKVTRGVPPAHTGGLLSALSPPQLEGLAPFSLFQRPVFFSLRPLVRTPGEKLKQKGAKQAVAGEQSVR